jgi:hypothetical protein
MTTDVGSGQVRAGAAPTPPPQVALLYRKVLAGETGLAQIWFHSSVLEKYVGLTGFRVLRTNSAGRIRASGGWTLDFGIADDAHLIHVSAADLGQRLPPAERQHWLAHIFAPPVSGTFLVMRAGAGHCMDDGDVRDWTG